MPYKDAVAKRDYMREYMRGYMRRRRSAKKAYTPDQERIVRGIMGAYGPKKADTDGPL